MRRSSSTNTSLQDLENAIRFLNKELSVRDIENIYGDFNDPTFQAALKEVKGNLDDITRAVNLRSLVLLKNSYNKWMNIIDEKINKKGQELEQANKTLNIYTRFYNNSIEEEKKNRQTIQETQKLWLQKIGNLYYEELQRLSSTWEQWMADAIAYNKRQVLKAKNKVIEQENIVGELEVEQTKLGIQLSRVEKQIYATQMATLVNVMQNMFTMVLDNIIY